MPEELTLLPSVKARTWTEDSLPSGWVAVERYQSVGSHAQFEVVVASAPKKPLAGELQSVWRQRQGGRATDVLLVVRYSTGTTEHAAVVGVTDASWRAGISLSAVVTSCTEALAAPTPTAARNAVAPLFVDGTDAPTGLRNEGLFATYALETYRTRHPQSWDAAASRASGIRDTQGTDLLRHLGWQVDVHNDTHLLREDGHSRAVAVLLQGDEVFDRPSLRFGLGVSPVEHALAVATKQEVPWVQAVQGRRIRLYPARADLSIRRTGLTSYVEINVAHLSDDDLAYTALLLSPEALRDKGTAFDVLADSRTRATALGARLRDRVYDDVVPELATIVARHATPSGEALSEPALNEAYHRTLVILFRTLFVAYAEDRGLLPYTGDSAVGYNRVALKNRAREWTDSKPSFDPNATDLWDGLTHIWHAVFHGSTDWGVPQYGGGLFDDDTNAGKEIARLRLTNAEIGPALEALLIDGDRDDVRGPVDFETLSVREFGTIYEGLLESSLSIAPMDLMLDKDEVYVPAKPGGEVKVHGGEVYFHNSSGARKATGSYFTKEFAVEHLLTTALDPTLDEHLERVLALVDSERTADAAALFFDFRVADIAMGSGHFLVGAVDHLATKMSLFLTDHPIDGVITELHRLRDAAVSALKDVGRAADSVTLTPESLVRRQVARRCVYGVDINEIAVDLARLALWIHTFVPGLPMSSLDHGLVWGNSLTGIATTDELFELLEPDSKSGPGIQSLFRGEIDELLKTGRTAMQRAAVLAEATPAESLKAVRMREEGEQELAPVRALFNVALAGRLGVINLRALATTGKDALIAAASYPEVREVIDSLHPIHFPVTFPEVFDRGCVSVGHEGFDVVLGNPPWEKVKVEEHGWWGLRFPGLRSMPQKDKNAAITNYRRDRTDLLAEYDAEVAAADALRTVLKAGPYEIGSGDTDLYKVFCWRDWDLLREGGRAGVVFPRGALSGSGTAAWRRDILKKGRIECTTLINTRHWVFSEIDTTIPIDLVTFSRGEERGAILSGPFHSIEDMIGNAESALEISAPDLIAWSDQASFPLLPSASSTKVFRKLRSRPRFDDIDDGSGLVAFRPVRELDATGDKPLLDFDITAPTAGGVPVLGGRSFNLWDPGFGEPYAYADLSELVNHLLTKRLRQSRTSSSAFYGVPVQTESDLPLSRARIAFRDVTKPINQRTALACLVPPNVSLVHNAPYLFRQAGAAFHEAFILGVVSSRPFDWYVRRLIDKHFTFSILDAAPIPGFGSNVTLRKRTIEISGRLAAIDDRFADWAAEVGVPVGSVTSDAMKEDLVAELDAVVSHLYGLDRDDVIHIFETFHRGWDHLPRLTAVLEHFDRWSDA